MSTAGKEADKKRKRGKQPLAEEASAVAVARPKPPNPMDRAQLSGMLGHLKYHAGHAKSTMVADAKKVLDAYKAADMTGKRTILARFQGVNGKKLGWAKEFVETTAETEATVVSQVKDWYLRSGFLLEGCLL